MRPGRHLDRYVALLRQNVPERLARSNSFGRLDNLESRLYGYIRRSNHNYFVVEARAKLKAEGFRTRTVGGAEATAVMAAFEARMGHRSEAQDALEGALRQEAHPLAQLELATWLHDSGEEPRARELFEELVKAKPETPPAHYRLGFLARKAGDRQVHFRTALKPAPRYAPAMKALADLLMAETDRASLDEAERLLRQASDLEPAAHGHKLGLCRLLLRREKPDEAVSIAQRLAAIMPPGARDEAKSILEESVRMKARLANRRN